MQDLSLLVDNGTDGVREGFVMHGCLGLDSFSALFGRTFYAFHAVFAECWTEVWGCCCGAGSDWTTPSIYTSHSNSILLDNPVGFIVQCKYSVMFVVYSLINNINTDSCKQNEQPAQPAGIRAATNYYFLLHIIYYNYQIILITIIQSYIFHIYL